MVSELMTTEQRLVELETRVAFQDDLIQTLNDTIARQQIELDLITRQFKELNELVRTSQSQIRDLQQETPPPHY